MPDAGNNWKMHENQAQVQYHRRNLKVKGISMSEGRVISRFQHVPLLNGGVHLCKGRVEVASDSVPLGCLDELRLLR